MKTFLLLLCFSLLNFSTAQQEEPIEYTRQVYVEQINQLDSLLEISSMQLFSLEQRYDSQTAYCEGWEDGYIAGYCYRKYGCIEPIPPVCPIPEINEDGYRDGYNRGFIKGRADQ